MREMSDGLSRMKWHRLGGRGVLLLLLLFLLFLLVTAWLSIRIRVVIRCRMLSHDIED